MAIRVGYTPGSILRLAQQTGRGDDFRFRFAAGQQLADNVRQDQALQDRRDADARDDVARQRALDAQVAMQRDRLSLEAEQIAAQNARAQAEAIARQQAAESGQALDTRRLDLAERAEDRLRFGAALDAGQAAQQREALENLTPEERKIAMFPSLKPAASSTKTTDDGPKLRDLMSMRRDAQTLLLKMKELGDPNDEPGMKKLEDEIAGLGEAINRAARLTQPAPAASAGTPSGGKRAPEAVIQAVIAKVKTIQGLSPEMQQATALSMLNQMGFTE